MEWKFKCKNQVFDSSTEFYDCLKTGLPCPHAGIMAYTEFENELDGICFFAQEVINRRQNHD